MEGKRTYDSGKRFLETASARQRGKLRRQQCAHHSQRRTWTVFRRWRQQSDPSTPAVQRAAPGRRDSDAQQLIRPNRRRGNRCSDEEGQRPQRQGGQIDPERRRTEDNFASLVDVSNACAKSAGQGRERQRKDQRDSHRDSCGVVAHSVKRVIIGTFGKPNLESV